MNDLDTRRDPVMRWVFVLVFLSGLLTIYICSLLRKTKTMVQTSVPCQSAAKTKTKTKVLAKSWMEIETKTK